MKNEKVITLTDSDELLHDATKLNIIHAGNVNKGSRKDKKEKPNRNLKVYINQLLLVTIDLLSIAIPSIYLIESVSVIYPILFVVALPFVFRENKLYWQHGRIYEKIWLQVGQIIRSFMHVFLIYCVFVFLFEVAGIQSYPTDLLSLFCMIVAANIFFRLAFAYCLSFTYSKKPTRFVILGNTAKAHFLSDELKQHPRKMNFLGFVVERNSIEQFDELGINVLGFVDDLESLVEQYRIESLVVVMEDSNVEELLKVTDVIALLPVDGYIFNDQFNVIRQRYWSIGLGSIQVSAIGKKNSNKTLNLVKRTFDIVVSSTAILVAFPIFIIIALTIKATSSGPALYISKRVCKRDGGTFDVFKFRSMYVRQTCLEEERKAGIERGFSGEVIDSENTKVVPKGAVTPFGYFLRKSSLDELPQLLNVLKGDMSIVGPRPDTPYEFKRYQEWHKRRLDVKPGITGLWQVVARSKATFDEMVKLDLYYIDQQSVWFDLEILIKTIPVMLLGKGGG